MQEVAVVTGGAGFIGSHIVDRLIEKNFRVIVIDDLSNGEIKNLNKKALFHKHKISEVEVRKILSLEKPDYIFHLAATSGLSKIQNSPSLEINESLLGASNILEYASPSKTKIIFFSSAAVYGENKEIPLDEDSTINPRSFYGAIKFIVENFIRDASKHSNFNYVIFRPANVYGVRQKSNLEGGVIANFSNNLKNSTSLTIYGDGRKTRDFIYVDDIVEASLMGLASNIRGIFNIGTEKQTSIFELANLAKSVYRKKVKILFKNDRLAEVKHSALSSKKLKRYNWQPKVELKEGLKILASS